jgi:hypothetical protein
MKMKYLHVIIFLLSMVPLLTFSQEDKSDSKITKEANTVKTVSLEALPFIKKLDKDTDLYVVVFLGTDCPISQKYGSTLRKFDSLYQDRVTFFGIIPNNFSEKKIRNFKKEYGITFELIKDHNNSFAKEFGAKVTPEAFLFDQNGVVGYHGAIDNWFYSLGRNKLKPTEHYLQDAIADIENGRLVKTPYVKAVGCFIEMKKQ